MSKPTTNEMPPAYENPPTQPSQAHLDPRANNNNTTNSANNNSVYTSPHPSQAGYISPGPVQAYQHQGYASPGPQQGFYGHAPGPHQEGMYYAPQEQPPQGWNGAPPQQSGWYYGPPQHQQGGYYQQQYPQQYPQGGYYDDRGRGSSGTGCLAICAGTLAACCCLDMLMF